MVDGVGETTVSQGERAENHDGDPAETELGEQEEYQREGLEMTF